MEYDQDLQETARQHFREAHKEAFVNEVLAMLSGKPNDLLSFRDVQQKLGLQMGALGHLETVPVHKIVGSEGRYHDFDRDFLPLHRDTEERWRRLDVAYQRMEDIPAIELYKVGDAYFVRDGNHRVSVAKRHGVNYIDAYVIDVPSRIKLDSNIDVKRLLVEQEHLQFLNSTHLDEILGTDIVLTAIGAYSALQRHIDGHRYFLGQERKADITFAEAVKSWYKKVYLPTVKIIRKMDVLKFFPGRTEGDLYLWIIEHHYYLRQHYGQDISLEDATLSFAKHYGIKPYHRVLEWLMLRVAKIVGGFLSWFRR